MNIWLNGEEEVKKEAESRVLLSGRRGLEEVTVESYGNPGDGLWWWVTRTPMRTDSRVRAKNKEPVAQ